MVTTFPFVCDSQSSSAITGTSLLLWEEHLVNVHTQWSEVLRPMERAGLGALAPLSSSLALPGAAEGGGAAGQAGSAVALGHPSWCHRLFCTALNKCTVTSIAISFTPHCQPCSGLAFCFLVPGLSQPVQGSILLRSLFSSQCFPCWVLSWQWQHGWHRKSNKGSSKFGPGKMKSYSTSNTYCLSLG